MGSLSNVVRDHGHTCPGEGLEPLPADKDLLQVAECEEEHILAEVKVIDSLGGDVVVEVVAMEAYVST